ncbi:MAG: nucleoside deaminase, partial [Flavobacteriales bacterium]|nr:nucleoside deaminase [Flavobacteriales bacterium]
AFTAASEFLGGKYLDKCTLYVTLEPCVMCGGAAFNTHLGKIVYGASDEKRGFSKFESSTLKISHPKTTIDRGILEEECSTILSEFFARRRQKR